jgi:uncharacterized protein (TIGR02271 family)
MKDPHQRGGNEDLPFRADDEVSTVRREEQLTVGRVEREVGRVRIRKTIEEQPVDDVVTRGVEHADIQRLPPNQDDSGQIETLPDGSVSIPVLEEQLVVERRVVVRERIVVRKRVLHEEERVEGELRREVVDVDVDPPAHDLVHLHEGRAGPDGP